MTPRQREIRDAYRRLKSVSLAAAELGISHQRVSQVLDELEEPRQVQRPTDELVTAVLPQLKRARGAGKRRPVTDLALEAGITAETLRSALRRRGLDTSSNLYGEHERAEWERLYLEEGMSAYAIARRRRVPRSTVSRHITARGIGRDRLEAARAALENARV